LGDFIPDGRVDTLNNGAPRQRLLFGSKLGLALPGRVPEVLVAVEGLMGFVNFVMVQPSLVLAVVRAVTPNETVRIG